MTASNATGLHQLGIAGTDEDLLETARSEPAIVTEAAARVRTPKRQRPGPLPAKERKEIVDEATSSLRRSLFALLLATDGLPEVTDALARVGLELRRHPPPPDTLAASLRKDL